MRRLTHLYVSNTPLVLFCIHINILLLELLQSFWNPSKQLISYISSHRKYTLSESQWTQHMIAEIRQKSDKHVIKNTTRKKVASTAEDNYVFNISHTANCWYNVYDAKRTTVFVVPKKHFFNISSSNFEFAVLRF